MKTPCSPLSSADAQRCPITLSLSAGKSDDAALAPVPMPANAIAAEVFLEDAFAAMRARLVMLWAIDPSKVDDDSLSDALAALTDDITDALAYHEAQRTPWASNSGPVGADHETKPVVRPVSPATPPAVTSPWLEVPRNREVLRSAAEITASIETARSMIAETDSADCPDWVTNHAIDTVLNCAQLAADTLYTLVAHHIGEDDATPGADNARG